MTNQNKNVFQLIGGLVVFGLLWLIGNAVLPNHLPPGPVLDGLILGGLNALTAMGLVLIYRSARIINFAHMEIGGVASSVAVVLVLGNNMPYVPAVIIGLVVALIIGVFIDRVVIWRFQSSPRLVLTVATLGLSLIFSAIEYVLPNLYHQGSLKPSTDFTVPWNTSFTITSFRFTGNQIVAGIAVPIIMIALWWFIGKTDIGAAIRASADSSERALLLGIPVRRLSLIIWCVASVLAGVGAIFSQSIVGVTPGTPLGPTVLLAPLAAAAIARFDSLPVTMFASLFIGVFEEAVYWSEPNSSWVFVALFLLIAVSLLVQRQLVSRQSDSGLGGFVAIQEVRPLPRAVRQLPIIRIATFALIVIVAAVLIGVPFIPGKYTSSDTWLLYYSTIAIYAIIAVSLVVLTGWAGQISLGQYAFTGAGASAAAVCLVSLHLNFGVAIIVSAIVGAIIAVIIGIPALRLPGLYLAVITLAFSVMLNTALINQSNIPVLAPTRLPDVTLFNRFDLGGQRTFYYVCIAVLGIAIFLARNLQRSRSGRIIKAIRDNSRAGSAYGASPLRARLVAFAFSGSLAGLAGALLAVSLGGIPSGGFPPDASLSVFTMVVFGGMGSILGGVLGAVFVETIFFVASHSPALQTFGNGIALSLLLFFYPKGVSGLVYAARDFLIRKFVPQAAIDKSLSGAEDEGPSTVIPGPAHDAAMRLSALEDLEVAGKSATKQQAPTASFDPTQSLVAVQDINAGYGKAQILYGVSFEVGHSEILALLGTNGAGKSTILRVIAGVLHPQSGKVFFEGEDITHLTPIERVKRGLVTVPGGRGIFSSLTVRENLRLAGWLTKKDRGYHAEAMARIFSLFPTLQDRLDTPAGLLSGGEQQMLTVSQALLCR
ncbi:MAG: ATP-binding cassette domain-containing protein, partial [Acidimicrobiales bacterium]|nr:ATP-binding cassette domain-containing protein [Acidimicrobiales bacterium]